MPAVKTPLRVAAIRFLNPAPLLYGFEHEPQRSHLLNRYELQYTTPARCAGQLRTAEAGLGLVPIGAMPFLPGLLAVPHCTIASLQRVRSIQLVLKPDLTLQTIRSVAADEASRSSAAYARILLRAFYGNDSHFQQSPATLHTMLRDHDAALLIGDPALFALKERDENGSFADCQWFDLAELWRQHTGLPWVAAVWAVRREALKSAGIEAASLIQDLVHSRDAGLGHIETLVSEWTCRLPLEAGTIREYLTSNIHYELDPACIAAIQRFFELGDQTGTLPRYSLPMLGD